MKGYRLLLVSILLVLPFIGWSITRISLSNHLDNTFTYHIDRASATSDIDEAANEMHLAKQYLEKRDMAHGYTSVVWRSEDEDLGVFYGTIVKRSNYLDDLQTIHTRDKTVFEDMITYTRMTNMKAQEQKVPDGISIYPHNVFFVYWFFVSLVLAAVGIGGMFVYCDERN